MKNDPTLFNEYKSNESKIALSSFTEEEKNSIKEVISTSLEDYERLKKYWFVPFLFGMFIGTFITFFFISFFSLLIGAVIGVIFAFGYMGIIKKQTFGKGKDKVIPVVMKTLYGKDAAYEREDGWSPDIMKNVGLFQIGNDFSSSDKIEGSYKGVDFVASNVSSKQVTSNGKSTTTVTYFEGVVAIYQFNKSISSSLEIREDENGFGKSKVFNKKNKIDFEDKEFNDQFNVYCPNPEEAFYVITPQFILGFKEIKRRVPGSLIFCIQSDRLVIAINGLTNNFDFNKKSNNADDILKSIVGEVLPFKWFVDIFNLDDSFSSVSVKRKLKKQSEENEINNKQNI